MATSTILISCPLSLIISVVIFARQKKRAVVSGPSPYKPMFFKIFISSSFASSASASRWTCVFPSITVAFTSLSLSSTSYPNFFRISIAINFDRIPVVNFDPISFHPYSFYSFQIPIDFRKRRCDFCELKFPVCQRLFPIVPV